MTLPANRALRYGIIVRGVFAAIVLLVMFFPWNMLRGPLASYASAPLRSTRLRSTAISTSISGWTTRMQIDGLSIANVAVVERPADGPLRNA